MSNDLREMIAEMRENAEDRNQEIAQLRAVVTSLVDALVWASRSADFAPEGQAYEGWQKVAEPALEQGMNIIHYGEG